MHRTDFEFSEEVVSERLFNNKISAEYNIGFAAHQCTISI